MQKDNLLVIAALLSLSFDVTCADADQQGASGSQFLNPAEYMNNETVITATRLHQPVKDAPAATTVITADMIQLYGIRSIPDALRFVPGMLIVQPSGNDFRINYHGTNVLSPRRMNILLDGVPLYGALQDRIDWSEMPVAIEDVDRIEVVRGANSAAYGPNSMLAVINILTKHPADVPNAYLSAGAGSRKELAGTARLGFRFGATTARLTVARNNDEGYETLSRVAHPHDSTALTRVGFRSVTTLDDSSTIDVSAWHVGGVKEVPFVDRYQVSFPDQHVNDAFLGVSWTKSFSETASLLSRASYSQRDAKQRWQTCIPATLLLPEMFSLWRANPAYALAIAAGRRPSGGSSTDDTLAAAAITAIRDLGPQATKRICSTPNQDYQQTRTDVESQLTLVPTDRFRAVVGLGARGERVESETLIGGKERTGSWRAFGNAEYKFAPSLRLHLGGFYENDRIIGSTLSPRAAFTYDVTPHQTLRVVMARGTRTPDLREQRTDWTYTATDFNPPLNGSTTGRFFQSAQSTTTLNREEILNREVGYLISIPAIGVSADLKVFSDQLTSLVSEKLQVSDFHPTNNGRVHLKGAELQLTVNPTPHWQSWLSYACLRQSDRTPETEATQYSKRSGSLGLAYRQGREWQWSAAHFFSSGDGLGQASYSRTDTTLRRTFQVNRVELTASLTVSYLSSLTSSYYRDVGDFPSAAYKRHLGAFFNMAIEY